MQFAQFKLLTRWEQTLYSLPTLFSALLLTHAALPLEWNRSLLLRLLWILLALVSARSCGMAFNQLIDRHFDAQNPRTANRLLPRKEISVQQVRQMGIVSGLLFLFSALQLGSHCALLSLPIGALLIFYSYMKRFSWICHFALGALHFLVPVATSYALKATFIPSTLFLGLFAGLSVAAYDIFYAMQDEAFDRAHALHSLPARFGGKNARKMARGLQVLSLFALSAVFLVAPLHPLFLGAPPLLGALFFLFPRFGGEFRPIYVSLTVLILTWGGLLCA